MFTFKMEFPFKYLIYDDIVFHCYVCIIIFYVVCLYGVRVMNAI